MVVRNRGPMLVRADKRLVHGRRRGRHGNRQRRGDRCRRSDVSIDATPMRLQAKLPGPTVEVVLACAWLPRRWGVRAPQEGGER